jgi:hypothetical protein
MFISLNHRLPTLNGVAWGPEGWNLMNPPDREYRERARAWMDDHHLDGVCGLDMDARTMRLAIPALMRACNALQRRGVFVFNRRNLRCMGIR